MKKLLVLSALLAAMASASTANAQNASNKQIKREIRSLKNSYEKRISDLEKKLGKIEEDASSSSSSNKYSTRKIFSNDFNPSIGIILNGKYASYSQATSEMKGFAVSHEGERGEEGFSLGESELNFSANIDDKFYGSLTAAIVRENGADAIELEESFIQTRPELGLPTGMTVKAGRSFWNIGYLNEQHAHTDDFADRPLPYRAFLNKAYNDDGAQLSYVLPTNFYSEIGGGVFAGSDFPSGSNTNDSFGNYSFYGRVGADITENQNFRVGAYFLRNSVGQRTSNENMLIFKGSSDLYVFDARYEFAPTSNAKNSQIILQGEYFLRDEEGTYNDTTAGTTTGEIALNKRAKGWYAQGVYKFLPNWRLGYRYTALDSYTAPAGLVGSLADAQGHDPFINSVMLDWTNSEFSRIRFQFNQDKTVFDDTDNQFLLQYTVSIGAHGAHKY